MPGSDLKFPLTDVFILFVFTISFKGSKKEEWWDVLMDFDGVCLKFCLAMKEKTQQFIDSY